MRIVFFGTPEFAVASLEKLIKNGMNVVACVTAPDKPSGRGLQMQSSAVKLFCERNNINVLQPINLKDSHFIDELRALKADLQIVVAFRMLPEIVWNMPSLGTYNLHASLLPKYRGAAPINWCIINGEQETGVTTFKLQHQIDSGSILYATKVSINETTTAGQLHDELKEVGAELLLKTVKDIEHSFITKSELRFIQQHEDQVTHAPKLFKEHCIINWSKPLKDIYNLIRGLSPIPGASTSIFNGEEKAKNLKIFSLSYFFTEHQHTNGFVSTDNKSYLHVYCYGGYIAIHELQLEGKKRMKVEDFLRGFALNSHACMK